MNKNLFSTAPPVDLTANNAGGTAYSFAAEHALAQYVLTGCFNSTFYVDAEADVPRVLQLCAAAGDDFLARLAVYSREVGYMKDAPALLLAVLSVRNKPLFNLAFPRVVDNAKMLRNFVQVVRSGAAGRKSLGTGPQARVAEWLNTASDRALINGSVGADPSLADVIKLSRPKAGTPARSAIYAWLIGKPADEAALPQIVRDLVAFRANPAGAEVPDVEFRLLDQYLTDTQWKAVARNAPWQMTRMNLNTFLRHGVFNDKALVQTVAQRLANPEFVRKSRVMPYQLLAAYRNASEKMPQAILEALHAAVDVAVENVPEIVGRAAVFPDVSGSMAYPVTGYRKGSTSKVRCIDAAALVASAMLAKNPDAIIWPFAVDIVDGLKLSAHDSVLTNATKLASVGGGGTAVSVPMARMLARREVVDLVVYVSDNESWADGTYPRRRGTALSTMWKRYKKVSPNARLVCIDITPNATTQVREAPDVLNIGGFSDAVFTLLRDFAKGEARSTNLVDRVNAVEL